MRDPNPTVILIPGIGMIAWGKNKSESRVTAEFYNCAIEVMRGAEAMDEYIALPPQEAFDIEYWTLEEAKLRRMPAEKELARRVVVVIGAGNGIGKSVAHRIAKEGAHIVSADMAAEAANGTADELTKIYGQGIGVAGTGISGCGPAIGAAVDITKRPSIRELYRQAILAYGGIDHLVVTAGVFIAPDKTGRVTDEQWQLTFDVNVTRLVQRRRRIQGALCRPGASRVLDRADDVGERGRVEERLRRLRLLEGGRESSRPRDGDEVRPKRPRQRHRTRHRCRRLHDVPARPRHRLADQVQHPV